MDTIGHHYIAEASGCKPDVIGKVEAVERILVRAAEVAGVQVWSISFHRFDPNGVSGGLVVSRTHMPFQTWPGVGYVALDTFTSAGPAEPEKAVQCAPKAIGPTARPTTEVSPWLEEGGRAM